MQKPDQYQVNDPSKGIRERGLALHGEVRKKLRKSTSENITPCHTVELCHLLGGRSTQTHTVGGTRMFHKV